MKQGWVYVPSSILPPGQDKRHFIVVLTNNTILGRLRNSNNSYITVAIIRSASNAAGNPVSQVMGHSIPITPLECPWLSWASIVETHQLFHVPVSDLNPVRNKKLGELPSDILNQVLAGARRVF